MLSREWQGLRGSLHPRLRVASSCARLLPEFTLGPLRALFFRWAGCDIGNHVSFNGPPLLIGPGHVASRLHIGQGTLIAPHVVFCLDGDITIGRNVTISPYCKLYTASHRIGCGAQRMRPAVMARPIVVEDGVWVGMDSLILPGVTLGQGSVISAGSVVTQDVPPNTLVSGNPAVVRTELPFGDR
jgi:acetyltransferase-like isoleucine patch superfamily enzyme